MMQKLKLSLLAAFMLIFGEQSVLTQAADEAAQKQWQEENPLPISDEKWGELTSQAYRDYDEEIKQRYLARGYAPVKDFWGNTTWRNKKEVELEGENRFKPYIDLSFLEQKEDGFDPKGVRQNYPTIWFLDHFICANPITSFTLATGTTASVLAYLYYRYNHQSKQNEPKDHELSVEEGA